jgi:hypothetical protein
MFTICNNMLICWDIIVISLCSLFWKKKNRRLMIWPRYLYPPTQILKAWITDPEETPSAVPYKYVWCDIMPQSQNTAAKKLLWRRPMIGNGLVIKCFNSWVSVCCEWQLTTVLNSELSPLCNFGSDCREKVPSNSFCVISLLSLHVCLPYCC